MSLASVLTVLWFVIKFYCFDSNKCIISSSVFLRIISSYVWEDAHASSSTHKLWTILCLGGQELEFCVGCPWKQCLNLLTASKWPACCENSAKVLFLYLMFLLILVVLIMFLHVLMFLLNLATIVIMSLLLCKLRCLPAVLAIIMSLMFIIIIVILCFVMLTFLVMLLLLALVMSRLPVHLGRGRGEITVGTQTCVGILSLCSCSLFVGRIVTPFCY